MSEERFDGMFLAIAQQEQGIDGILNSFFGFLRRKTDFFVQGDLARASVQKAMNHHLSLAEEQQRKTREANEAAARRRAAKEESESHSRVEVLEDEEEIQAAALEAAAHRKKEVERQQAELIAAQAAEGDEADKPKGLKPTAANGFEYETYSFSQTLREVEVRVPLPAKGVKGKQVDVEIRATHLRVGMKGRDAIVDGELFGRIRAEESMWTIEDGSTVVITLYKQNDMEWWKTVLQGDLEIDLQKVVPENSKLDDLDSDTRQTVEKMMYDQRQKALGKPTSEEQQKKDMLNKFMAAHPEMDFSQAKFC